MSLVQKLKASGTLAESASSRVLHKGFNQSHCIDVVFDVYREMSIKDAERSNLVNGQPTDSTWSSAA